MEKEPEGSKPSDNFFKKNKGIGFFLAGVIPLLIAALASAGFSGESGVWSWIIFVALPSALVSILCFPIGLIVALTSRPRMRNFGFSLNLLGCLMWVLLFASAAVYRSPPITIDKFDKRNMAEKAVALKNSALTGVNYFFPSTTITFPVLLGYLDPGGNGMRA